MSFELSIESQGFRRNFIKREVSIPSQFFFAPINTGFAFNGEISQRFTDFYSHRSGHGLGITYVGNVSVARGWITNNNTPILSVNNIQDWKKIASIIKRNGSVPAIQLACRASKHESMREWKQRNPSELVNLLRNEFSALPKEKIDVIFKDFLSSAGLAVEAGFEIIQLHAAHGYFLSQLLDPRINCRKDCYGSDPLGTILSLISEIRSMSKFSLIDIRLSITEGFDEEDFEYARKIDLIEQIVTDLDIVSLSNGTYDLDKNLVYPSKCLGHGPFIKMAIPLSLKYPSIIWNVAGNIWDIRKIPTGTPQNLAFCIGRAIIADPEIIEKSLTGNYDTIRWCRRCGDCHYYSKGMDHIYCPLEITLSGTCPVSIKCQGQVTD
jgi:2,4-dienoyl-CoA reductase-like NADH-dependent reductase (Old Yellow Enzyme family)